MSFKTNFPQGSQLIFFSKAI